MFRERECAGWGARVGAYLIDYLIAAVIPLALGIVLAIASENDAVDAIGGLLIIFGSILTYPLYAAIAMARGGDRAGQTIGKQAVGIRVVRDGGERVTFGYALLRELVVRWLLLGFVGGFFLLPPLLDVLWPLWDDSNRALHDMIVSSHVVRADDPPSPMSAE
jgi:uncharacterized RDD family membrane protein YckC